jgi:hypothetical protein
MLMIGKGEEQNSCARLQVRVRISRILISVFEPNTSPITGPPGLERSGAKK